MRRIGKGRSENKGLIEKRDQKIGREKRSQRRKAMGNEMNLIDLKTLELRAEYNEVLISAGTVSGRAKSAARN